MGKYNNAAWILWTLSWCRVHITTSHSKKEQNRKFEVNIDVDNHDHGHADCAVAQNIAQVCFAYCCETDLIAHFERVWAREPVQDIRVHGLDPQRYTFLLNTEYSNFYRVACWLDYSGAMVDDVYSSYWRQGLREIFD